MFYIFADERSTIMGVTFDSGEQRFLFDFEHDSREDIVSLTGDGYQVEAFGRCFYYGYEFAEQVDGNVRSAHPQRGQRDSRLQPHRTQRPDGRIDVNHPRSRPR